MPDFAQETPFSVELPSGGVLRGSAAGDGHPIVLLHGLSATRRYVTQGSKRLTRDRYRLIAYDSRGHGESDPAPEPGAYGYDELVGDLLVVLDTLGIDRPVLAGSSMGAHVALNFALANPARVRALVLITPAFTGDLRPGGWDELADRLDAGDLDGFVELAAAGVPDRVAETVRTAVRQRVERHRHPAAVADAMRVIPRSKPLDSLDRLGEIAAPTLVVGSRDEMDPGHPLAIAREYAERIPGAEFAIEDEGKSPLAWQGAQLSKRIGDFVAALDQV